MKYAYDDFMGDGWPSVKARTAREILVRDCSRHIAQNPRDPHIAEVSVCLERARCWVIVLTYFTHAVYS